MVTRPFVFVCIRLLQPEKAQRCLPIPTAVFDLIPLAPRRDLFPGGVLDNENPVLRQQGLSPDESQRLADQVSLIGRVGKDDVEPLSPVAQKLKAAIDGNLDHFDILPGAPFDPIEGDVDKPAASDIRPDGLGTAPMALHEDHPGGPAAHGFEPHAARPRKKIQKPFSGHGEDVEKGFLDTVRRRSDDLCLRRDF